MENELENLKEILGHLKLNKQVVKVRSVTCSD